MYKSLILGEPRPSTAYSNLLMKPQGMYCEFDCIICKLLKLAAISNKNK